MIDFLNKTPNILVVGDLMIDQYLWGDCERISPEAPVQIININHETRLLGGAGNVVNNLKKLSSNVDIISVIGDCQISNELKLLLKENLIKTKYLTLQKSRISSKKTRIIASQQQVVRYDFESKDDINLKSEKSILRTFKKIFLNYDLILLSDYGKGVLTENLTKSLIQIANKSNKKVLVDPKGINYFKYNGAYTLTPNKKEASEATKIDIRNEASLLKSIKKLKQLCNLKVSIVTLSENGIAIYDKNFRILPTVAREVYDVTGAGDTVLAALGFAIASGSNIDEAVEFSNLAASVVVGKIGSATASLDEINNYASTISSPLSDNIKSLDEIIEIVENSKLTGKKIVFTNGCFDLLHAGHISFLETAKTFGDVLIIGLNSDNSIKKLKGSDRPINIEKDRAFILSALKAVDYVVIFDEDTPYKLIKAIKPHTLVKGGDYQGKKVVGEDIVQELKLVKFVDGKSSTKTIEKIKKNN